MAYLLALDQGTSSSRSIVFDQDGRIVALSQRELTQIYPQPAWVEHDPLEIWASQLATARDALHKAGIHAGELAGIGITNQRETTLLWNRVTGEPLHNAIVWQDRRTEPACATLRAAGHEARIRELTGLVIDSYFSATKLQWMLDTIPGARAAAQRGELAFGTVDSWLLWRLTGGRVHATDCSNASRTLLYDIKQGTWSEELLALFDIPRELLPAVHPSAHRYGETTADLFGQPVPISGIAGDQQSALFGQACHQPGMAKNTYGTGCFMLMHTGETCQLSEAGLVTTRAAQAGTTQQYAMEGSIFVGGAVVQWLRDGLRAIQASSDVEALAASVPDNGGVVFVPAFTGLGAPYWNADARGAILGLTRGTGAGHIARAALESIAFQSTALLRSMNRDAVAAGCVPISELRVDGGASVNDLMMQFQADLLGIPVVRPAIVETTALGAAYLAGLGAELYAGLDDLASRWRAGRTFYPEMPRERAEEMIASWERAVRQTTAP
jgi:glycerol kinase